ncbi:MAG: patatin-like phospholipase family protein, partial [Gammaproteobacteria bacterium]
RRVGSDLDRVVLLAPSREFVATLPGGRIPDRDDFYRLSEAERLRAWETVIEASRRLGDEFAELTVSGAIRERVQPLTR